MVEGEKETAIEEGPKRAEAPDRIYLQIGDEADLGHVTWCRDRVAASDAEYRRVLPTTEDLPLCPSCENPLDEIGRAGHPSGFGVFFCKRCRKSIGVTEPGEREPFPQRPGDFT